MNSIWTDPPGSELQVCTYGTRLRTARAKSEVSLGDHRRTVALAFEGLPTAWSEPGPNLEKRVAMRRAIQQALALIPEEFRTVLLLRDVEELSSREVTEQLGIADTTVRQRLRRARAAMAELLRPQLCTGAELTCGGNLDLLLDYIDNVLPAELLQPVEKNIAVCEKCLAMLEAYRMTIGAPKAIVELTAVDFTDEQSISPTVLLADR